MKQPWSPLRSTLVAEAAVELDPVPPGSLDSDCQEGEEELKKEVQDNWLGGLWSCKDVMPCITTPVHPPCYATVLSLAIVSVTLVGV